MNIRKMPTGPKAELELEVRSFGEDEIDDVLDEQMDGLCDSFRIVINLMDLLRDKKTKKRNELLFKYYDDIFRKEVEPRMDQLELAFKEHRSGNKHATDLKFKNIHGVNAAITRTQLQIQVFLMKYFDFDMRSFAKTMEN